ncbi:MAG: ROK family protein [Cyclobacteriaceae bacterium]|nr:ROK family protein [Cyclobacteriaceae bacterium]MCH8516615.1 ROK family protein [Cyclobacteriaceae bacterium]
MVKYIGIDIGGTNVKAGVISEAGQILYMLKKPTFSEGYLSPLAVVDELLSTLKNKYPEVNKVGIGLPGMISKDRSVIVQLANIPQLNGINLRERMEQQFPDISFFIENDANAAALGEYMYSGSEMPNDFLFVTMGTGIGSAAILEGKIFKGGNGNAMELGHVLSRGNKPLEKHTGKQGMLEIAQKRIDTYEGNSLLKGSPLGSRFLIDCAKKGDQLSIDILEEVAEILAESMVGLIRIMDTNKIFIGGGLSACFPVIESKLFEVISKHLPEYYLEDLSIKQAKLANDAGLIGAGALCFDRAKVNC